jgi:beta-xylosidase
VRRARATAALALAVSAGCAQRSAAVAPAPTSESYPWVPDLGDGSYRNPVLFADYSDPDVIRAGDAYFLVASSFTSTPGLPILRSPDLVNWTIVGHALDNVPGDRYAAFQPGAGVWAPALRAHAGTFYLFAPTPDEGIYVLTAPAPAGPWSAPRLLLAGRGLIDPCPFWDDDGRAYLVHAYAGSRSGIKDQLRMVPLAPDASRVLGEGRIVFHDPARHPTLEGPKLYKRNGWYIILAPAGGVAKGWQVALRSRNVYGPYQDRIVLEQGATAVNGPHQGALVDAPDGSWWFVHFQDAGVYGRVVHLEPVAWEDDWPLLGAAAAGGRREPVARHGKPRAAPTPVVVPQTSDAFDGAALGPQWQWHANHHADWASLRARPGWLRLAARPLPADGLGAAPNLLLQKLPARSFTVETTVDAAGGGVRAGLVIAGGATASLAVEAGDGPGARRVVLAVDDRVVDGAPLDAAEPVRLGVAFADGGACRFWFASPGGAVHRFERVFQARPGRWVGAQIGLFAAGAGGHADFDAFTYGERP